MWSAGDFRVYVAQAFGSNVLGGPPQSHADRRFGGQASLNIKNTAYRSKSVVGHEYGHVQTVILQGGQSASTVDYGYDGDPDHQWLSEEWQSVACVEGYANLYATWVWNDETEVQAFYADVGDEVRFPVPSATAFCDTCPAGVANESDWAGAMYVFRRTTGASMSTVLQLLTLAWNGAGWVENGQSTDFWDNFHDQAALVLSTADLTTLESIAASWEIDH